MTDLNDIRQQATRIQNEIQVKVGELQELVDDLDDMIDELKKEKDAIEEIMNNYKEN